MISSRTKFALVLTLAAAVVVAVAVAQAPHSLPESLAATGTPALTLRASADVFGEGVAADWQGNVYFNEMGPNNRTMQLKVGQDSARIWRQAKDAPNGMWIDTQNRLVICQTRALVRVKPGLAFDDKTDTLYKYPDPATGQDFNDVSGDSKDNLYFTNFNGRSVFYRDAATGVTKEVLNGRPKPNGIEWDEERKTVYVCENEAGKVAAYAVGDDHTLGGRRDFATVPGADGIVLDEQGNVYAVAFGAAVHVFKPDGTKLGEIPIAGTQLTNLAFGGLDFKTLYMITNKGLYKLPMKVSGYKSGAPPVAIGPFRALRKEAAGSDLRKFSYRLDGRILILNGDLTRNPNYPGPAESPTEDIPGPH